MIFFFYCLFIWYQFLIIKLEIKEYASRNIILILKKYTVGSIFYTIKRQ